jgi:hypothetical protein
MSTTPETTPEWTVMLYLSGDNNLSPEMVRALNDIAISGVPNEINLAIQYAPVAPHVPTYRYFLDAGTRPNLEPSPGPLPLPDYQQPVPDAGSAAAPETLSDFIVASLTHYPLPSKRMLVLSGHGGGAIGDFLTDDAARKRQARTLTIPGLRRALQDAEEELDGTPEAGRFIQLLGMDSCLMSMVEVCYEVRHLVEYLVGSEGFVPNAGWPYGFLLSQLRAKIRAGNDLETVSMSQYIVDDYTTFYRDYMPASVSVDIAGCELARLDGLTDSLRQLAELLTDQLPPKSDTDSVARQLQNSVILAHWRAQSFKREQNTDLWDFCDLLEKEVSNSFGPIADACRRVKAAVAEVVGDRQRTIGIDVQYARGLALYFPWSLPIFGETRALHPYNQLEFPQACGWGRFIKTYVHATQRQPKPRTDGTLWPPQGHIERMNTVSVLNQAASGGSRDVPDEDRELADENRVLLQLFGSGQLPWSMKNPPQRVLLETGVQGSVAQATGLAHHSVARA